MNKKWSIAVVAVLALVYGCLEVFDAAQVVRQVVIAPVFCFGFVLSPIIHPMPGLSFVRALDVDHGGLGSSLLRTFVFSLFAIAIVAPWSLWLHTRKRRHLALSIAVLLLYLLSSVGFMAIIVVAVSGMRQ